MVNRTIMISVIICTHNPRRDYLKRVLDALCAQTLSRTNWELLVIDNASEQMLAADWDLSWHPLARHVREEELGLTPARLRGIAEAQGELLIFVDDDNVVSKDYLWNVIRISNDYMFLGAWGGTIRGEFEIEPARWLRPLIGCLGIREICSPVWSNNPEDQLAQPYGAGLCVRKSVATTYAGHLAVNPARRKLDRIGSNLSSCGDTDLVQTSCDLGYGFGNFPELRLTHLIAKHRLNPQYIAELMGGITTSLILLRYFRTGNLPPQPSTLRGWLKYALLCARRGRRQAWIYRACQEATREGIRMVHELPDQEIHVISR